ncbi:hypothetical protein EUTSA_v10003413mg [Eutrema salsugineum]|uniref:F-box associated beta-propeller type 3 domain-containing protein n=1 Tax=Eutrema salsugineum TaxID=72664 RepID=V4NF16_EUTSA|nr:hypothetical protein EUTSA_v10003413mg [Eutrema salsugineum]
MEPKPKKNTATIEEKDEEQSALSSPLDLTSEILLRLPEQSSSITTDPYFINLFKTRSPRTSLLLCFRKDNKLFVSSIPQHTQNSNSKRQFLPLPKPNPSEGLSYKTSFIGYDPIDGKHKVVCIPYSCNMCQVLILGSAQESWRMVETKYKHCFNVQISMRCIKGVIYYLALIATFRDEWVLLSFDVRSEKFHKIRLPSYMDPNTLINYGGRLACADKKKNKRFWILEDAEKHMWSSKDCRLRFGLFDKSLKTNFKLKDFTHAGEFVYAPSTFHKSRFEFKRIADDEPEPDDGVGNDMYELHVFPNHIESQMSL